MTRHWIATACGLLLAAAPPANASTPAPSAVDYVTLSQGIPVGRMTVEGDGRELTVHYDGKNNGRGPDLKLSWSVDEAGLPSRFEASGDTGLGVPADEALWTEADGLHWRSAGGAGSGRDGFYLPETDTPMSLALLARATLRTEAHELPLLPSGTARIEVVDTLELAGESQRRRVRLALLDGIGFGRAPLWLDDQDRLFALVDANALSTVRSGWEHAMPRLLQVQQEVVERRYRELARRLGGEPQGVTTIRHVDLFDAEASAMRRDMRVVVEGDRILEVGPDGAAPIRPGEIDGKGRTLLPGLWDMHAHLRSPLDGLLNVANGVLSVRDMGGDIDTVVGLRDGFDAGELIGPRMALAGLVDGPSATRNVGGVLVSTAAEVDEAIARFAEHGYRQLKIYSSVPPELLPQAIRGAHARGLRVGGHVPASIRMDDAVRLGFDDVSHAYFVLLNFLDDEVQQQTNTLGRVLVPARLGSSIDPDAPEVRESIARWCESGVVLDATAIVVEGLFTWQRGEVAAYMAPYLDRLPPAVVREFRSGGLPRDAEERDAYAASFQRMMELLGRFRDCGGRIVPGTDGIAGLMLAHELEIYVEAGMPPLDVLRMATLEPARMMGRDEALGSIAPGKLADLFLVEGDPSVDIGAIRDIEWVMRGGTLYPAADLDEAIGMKPRKP